MQPGTGNDPGFPIQPRDIFNEQLIAQVHPSTWQNPVSAGEYNLVVIGAGTAGLVTAAAAAGLGARVALVEKHLMGGDCLNYGCVPSKTLLRAAKAAAKVRSAGEFGVRVSGAEVDFSAVMERVRQVRAQISPHDSAERFQKLGVDVFLGEARFEGRDTISVGGSKLSFRRAVIATGARASEPEVPGLRAAGFLTNETVFSLTSRPRRLAVLGAGPIGCELAQAFQRLGSQVTLIHNKAHILDREDADAATVVQTVFQREGVAVLLETRVENVEATSEGKRLSCKTGNGVKSIVVDEILVATGRRPNVKGLNLEAAEVRYGERTGVETNDFLETSNPKIFAAGDVCLRWKFTHAADFAARIVVQNALFPALPFIGRKRLSSLMIPWCTFTDPEVAHAGWHAHSATDPVDVYEKHFKDVDRAATEGEADGFVKILTKQGTDKIVGATIVGEHAGELISEISVAMAAGMGLGRLASVIHPYPTRAEAIRQLGDAYNRTRLTPTVRGILNWWLK